MSHEIEHVAGKACMAWASDGDTPWHNLGKKVDPDLTPEQMLVEAGLSWTVRKEQAYLNLSGGDGGLVKVPDTFALVRSSDDKILDVVSDDWKEIQNIEAFEFFNDFVAAGDMSMHTAGSLKGGTIVWALAKIKDSFDLGGKDLVEAFMLFTNYHKYGFSTDVRFSPIRVVCANTLQLSLNAAANAVKVSHRKKFDGDEVKLTLGVAAEKLAKYKEMASYLSNKRYSDEGLIEYFMRLWPLAEDSKRGISRNAERALEAVETQPGHELFPGTWWDAYNSATYMVDHEIGRTDDSRLTSAWYGAGKNLKLQALELACEMAA